MNFHSSANSTDSKYHDIPDWSQTFVTDSQGIPVLIRRVPTDLPVGSFSLFDTSSLSPEQRYEGDVFHELGHAVAYMLSGVPVAVSMKENQETKSSAHVSPYEDEFERMNVQQRRIALAAGEWAGIRWLKESGLWSTVEEYVMEVRAVNDRTALRDLYNVRFTQESVPDSFETLLSDTGGLLDTYWNLIRSNAPDLIRNELKWWGWDETAERFGFSEILRQEHRLASMGVRDSHGRDDGVHLFEFDGHTVSVTRKNGDWFSCSSQLDDAS